MTTVNVDSDKILQDTSVLLGHHLQNVHYDFCIKMLFGSSLPPVVCRRPHVFLFTLYSGV